VSGFDVEAVRGEFPALAQRVHGKPLVYLDSAATSQKPRAVIDALARFYAQDNANVHRGLHALAERATAQLEQARDRVRRFLNAARASEIVFVRGTTEAINLIAHSFGRARVREGDEVIASVLEHHSNLVPWQELCRERGATLRLIDVDERGELRLDELERLLGPRTRLLAVAHVSNVLGTVNPIARICELSHARGVTVVVDGAQAAPHLPVDVRALGCDFYALSAHKVYGPMGVGALYGRAALLDEMPPWQTGGEMVQSVSPFEASWQAAPARFEAGTPDVAAAIGFAAALDWLTGLAGAREHERALTAHALESLRAIDGLRILGDARDRTGAISFELKRIHPHDVGTLLDEEGIAVRTGHLCAQPLMRRLGVTAAVRASLAPYNTHAEIDALAAALVSVRDRFA
jgi:cysteine desulfurase/selenocysteine lyase